jgi:hypothetical protein
MVFMKHMVNGLVMRAFKTGRQVVDWAKVSSFTVDGHEVQVLKNEMVVKVTKNGNERKERRLTVTIDGFNSVEVGTESVKKGTFITRLLKVTKVTKAQPTQQPTQQSCFIATFLESKIDGDVDREAIDALNAFWNDESEFDLEELERMVG